MANNSLQATVSPALPASLFSDAELQSLRIACSLDGEDLYFYAEECFSEQGEDEDGSAIDCPALLQEKLRRLDADEYPAIEIQGAATCSRMRPGEFGGVAYFITRDEIRSISTWRWLDARKQLDERTFPGTPAAALRAALRGMLEVFVESDQLGDYEDMATVKAARAAIVAYDTAGAAAAGAGISPAPGADPGDGPVRGADSRQQHPIARKLLAALTRLLDDLTDAEEDRNPGTGEEYASVAFARAARDEARAAGLDPAPAPTA